MRNYVYILRCSDDRFYTGWTNRLPERVRAHNEGAAGAKCTRARRPVTLIYAECYGSKKEAMAREYAIKQLTREKKEALILQGKASPGMAGDQSHEHYEEWNMGKLYYLMGKSATGKNKLYETLLADEALSLRPLVIYTTRPIRSGETDGVEYHFTDDAGLEALRESGKLIEERSYDTACGVWKYFTADDDSIDLTLHNYLAIGTPASFQKVRKYYGGETVIPIYVETEDGERLARALKRERKQSAPRYEEMCRRFLADQKDFAEEKLDRAGIGRRFLNNGSLEECAAEVAAFIRAGGNN